ncbi:hypothetical protein EIM44_04910 [Bibersteinia trehalosi]|uniref:Uncharacterized protein n=1 Tax=Bibersteinia trehalosi TaxID=47735 RepID=A0A426FJN3_BIBTR|nr:hypothetical protein [Bibersteinia trehalosi]RRN04781.1 hypothetical protein EIM44_04910 [Bibersteinia trehalosi]
MQQQPVIHFGPPVPVMSIERFANEIGAKTSWVEDQITLGKIPTMPKKGKEKPLVNVALYWQFALSQTY